MAILRIQDTPAPGGGTEMYDKVSEKMNVEGDPPAGMIFHSACRTDDDRILIVDVWESQEAFDRFSDDRLMPAIREVMGGDPPEGAATVQTHEVHNLVTP
jgi:heme-degrading monooxygenase HmoA